MDGVTWVVVIVLGALVLIPLLGGLHAQIGGASGWGRIFGRSRK